MPQRVLFLANPKSRRARDRYPAALRALREAGLDPVAAPCEGEGAVLAALERHRGAADAVVVGGGDGTLHEAAEGLVAFGAPLGILPLGTANDFARTLGLPTDVEAACRVIAAGHTRRVDLGEVNGRLFLNVASVGLAADVTGALTGQVKGRWGRLAYGIAALRVVRRARPFQAEIRHDGRTAVVRTLQVTVGNGRHHGGGMTVAEDAAPDDGLLDLYSLEVPSGWSLLRLAPALRAGTQGRRAEVRTLRAPEIVVTTDPPRPVMADGEPTASTPARFRVRPGALEVFVPPP